MRMSIGRGYKRLTVAFTLLVVMMYIEPVSSLLSVDTKSLADISLILCTICVLSMWIQRKLVNDRT
ncbi:hypothetical protein [Vibrio europaeus]|nr:hypothetical protein [Vibrio europaeus]MDC5728200.1 hypothetical protein [Vibrio europaeus]MDC5734412.1 hypothetical protein [Vibrio europaeus]